MLVTIEDAHLIELADKNFRGKTKYPIEVVKAYRRRVAQIKDAKNANDLRAIGSLHFEKLKSKEYRDKYSIRINQSYRLIFRIDNDRISGFKIIFIEDMNNHYS